MTVSKYSPLTSISLDIHFWKAGTDPAHVDYRYYGYIHASISWCAHACVSLEYMPRSGIA